MAQQVLHGADVLPALQQMGGEAVPQRVRGGLHHVVQAGAPQGELEGALEALHVPMVPALEAEHAKVGIRNNRKDAIDMVDLVGTRVLATYLAGRPVYERN